MPTTKLQKEFIQKEPVALISFNELPDWFGRETLKTFLRCSNSSVMELLNKPINEGGIPCRKIGNQYRIIKNEFGRAWGFISDNQDKRGD